jgi:hypothetical protein
MHSSVTFIIVLVLAALLAALIGWQAIIGFALGVTSTLCAAAIAWRFRLGEMKMTELQSRSPALIAIAAAALSGGIVGTVLAATVTWLVFTTN